MSSRRLPTNAPGDFYVEDTCIDCATCRWMAPETFDAARGASRVHTQPDGPASTRRALQALVACPTGSIKATERHPELNDAIHGFPLPVGDGAYHCGYHAASSYGAASWFVPRPEGNILVDSPRFSEHLARSLDAMGGVATLFLTHRDDVADHERWAARFGARRVIHAHDQGWDTRRVEQVIRGLEPVSLQPGATIIPTPGHTRGSACLLVDGVLLSGDTLAYSPRLGHVYAFRGACWYDWDTLIGSVERLAKLRFTRILPGHGHPCGFPPEEMARQMARCLAWMRHAGVSELTEV